MRLVKYDLNKINNVKGYKKTKNQVIIEEFAASDMDCAKVEDYTTKTSAACAWTLNNAIKRFKIAGIRAISRGDEVFLIRENAVE